MNIKYILLLSLLLLTNCLFAQTNPQFEFYGSSNLASLIKKPNNDVEESDRALFLAKIGQILDINPQQQLDLLYRAYEIECTSEIFYKTINEKILLFQCKDSVRNGIPVDFGTQLLGNKKKENGGFRLRFASQITTIDSAIFQSNVSIIKLPMNDDLEYKSSQSIDVSNLKAIYGKDVLENHYLIDKNRTLIVGALKGCRECVVPSEVMKVGTASLRGASVEVVVLQNGIREIAPFAFENCLNLKKVIINSERVVRINEKAFGEIELPKKFIYVPKTLLKDYKKQYPQIKKSFAKM